MKRLHLALGLLVVAFCLGLQAQVPDSHAEIPFDFWMGQKLMPAGDYQIYHLMTGVVMFEERHDRHISSMLLTHPVSRVDWGKGSLQFTRYGDTYFLWKIWSPYQTDGYAASKTTREKELAS